MSILTSQFKIGPGNDRLLRLSRNYQIKARKKDSKATRKRRRCQDFESSNSSESGDDSEMIICDEIQVEM